MDLNSFPEMPSLRLSRVLGTAAIGVGGLSYLFANSIVSGDAVSIYDVPLWIVGVALPLTVLIFDGIGQVQIVRWAEKRAIYIAAWIISLFGFVLLRYSLLINSFEDVIYEQLTFLPARYLLLSFIYSIIGYAGAIAMLSLGTWRNSLRRPWFQSLTLGLVANSLAFYGAVFALPRAAIF